jgi:gas vesicle protein
MVDIDEGKKTAVNLMIGTAIGGVAGLVLGVLFAPKAGKETREQIRTWLKQKRQQNEESPARPIAEPNHKEEVVLADFKNGKKTAANLLIGTAIGAVTGSALGVLFAPKAGKETREQVGTWLNEKRQQSTALLARINAEAKHKKEQVEAAWQAGRHAYRGVGPSATRDSARVLTRGPEHASDRDDARTPVHQI